MSLEKGTIITCLEEWDGKSKEQLAEDILYGLEQCSGLSSIGTPDAPPVGLVDQLKGQIRSMDNESALTRDTHEKEVARLHDRISKLREELREAKENPFYQ